MIITIKARSDFVLLGHCVYNRCTISTSSTHLLTTHALPVSRGFCFLASSSTCHNIPVHLPYGVGDGHGLFEVAIYSPSRHPDAVSRPWRPVSLTNIMSSTIRILIPLLPVVSTYWRIQLMNTAVLSNAQPRNVCLHIFPGVVQRDGNRLLQQPMVRRTQRTATTEARLCHLNQKRWRSPCSPPCISSCFPCRAQIYLRKRREITITG